MGTNYYFMSRNKELMQTCFAEKSDWGVLGEKYTIVDEPYLGYRCHLNKLSCGWRPLFQKHRVYEVNPISLDKKPHLRTVGCSEEEAELYSPFNHMEYEKTLQKARQKFGVYEREYGDIKYWNDPDYLFDWTEGEFM